MRSEARRATKRRKATRTAVRDDDGESMIAESVLCRWFAAYVVCADRYQRAVCALSVLRLEVGLSRRLGGSASDLWLGWSAVTCRSQDSRQRATSDAECRQKQAEEEALSSPRPLEFAAQVRGGKQSSCYAGVNFWRNAYLHRLSICQECYIKESPRRGSMLKARNGRASGRRDLLRLNYREPVAAPARPDSPLMPNTCFASSARIRALSVCGRSLKTV